METFLLNQWHYDTLFQAYPFYTAITLKVSFWSIPYLIKIGVISKTETIKRPEYLTQNRSLCIYATSLWKHLLKSIRNQEMNKKTLFSDYRHQAMVSQFQETLYPVKIG